MLFYFAGPIFTPQQALVFYLILFMLVGAMVGLAIFGASRLGRKLVPREPTRPPQLRRALWAGYGLVGALTLLLIVLPGIAQNISWKRTEQRCAKASGYFVPEEDSLMSPTFEAEGAYRDCLERARDERR